MRFVFEQQGWYSEEGYPITEERAKEESKSGKEIRIDTFVIGTEPFGQDDKGRVCDSVRVFRFFCRGEEVSRELVPWAYEGVELDIQLPDDLKQEISSLIDEPYACPKCKSESIESYLSQRKQGCLTCGHSFPLPEDVAKDLEGCSGEAAPHLH